MNIYFLPEKKDWMLCEIFLHCLSIEVTITTHAITAINKCVWAPFGQLQWQNPMLLPLSPSIPNQLKWLVILKDIYCKWSWESLSAYLLRCLRN